MCKKNSYLLRISNRGAGIREIVTNTTYEVNLPTQLRGKQCKVEIIDGLIVLDTNKSDFPTLKEVGILSDLGLRGFDMETEFGTNQFQATSFSTLFDVALQNFNVTASKTKVSFHTNARYECDLGSLPEKFSFSTYKISESEPALGSMVGGEQYKILTVGSTDFTLLGASSNTVGVVFGYNGASTSGSGTVLSLSTKNLYATPYYCSFVLKITEMDD
jgi:hypothetical protein